MTYIVDRFHHHWQVNYVTKKKLKLQRTPNLLGRNLKKTNLKILLTYFSFVFKKVYRFSKHPRCMQLYRLHWLVSNNRDRFHWLFQCSWQCWKVVMFAGFWFWSLPAQICLGIELSVAYNFLVNLKCTQKKTTTIRMRKCWELI